MVALKQVLAQNKIVPLNKNQTNILLTMWFCLGQRWLRGDMLVYRMVQCGNLEKATMDLSAGTDRFSWTNMFCPLRFVNAEPHKVKKKNLSVAANRCENKSTHSKRKKKTEHNGSKMSLLISFHVSVPCAMVGLGASQSVTGGGAPPLIKKAGCWNDTFAAIRCTADSLSCWRRRCVTWCAKFFTATFLNDQSNYFYLQKS